jgi:uncharacterized protein YdeI (YjbR/CyaY-like superfamily)
MAITYGMSVKEFWEDNPDLFWAYRFSYFTKIKTEQEIFNNNAWLQGAYFHEAITVALCNAFGKQKIKYSEKPYGFDRAENTEEKKKKQIEINVADIKARIAQVNAIRKNSTTDREIAKKVGEVNG